jgi:hypothetical protein
MRLRPIATPGDRPGQEARVVMSTTLRTATKAPRRYRLCRTTHSVKRDCCSLALPGMEEKHGHHRRTSVPGPFIAISFPLASLCAGMATFRGHPGRVAVIRLDGDPGLGRVGFDRSVNLRSAAARGPVLCRRAALIRQTKHRIAKCLERCQRLSRRPRPRETHRFAWDVPTVRKHAGVDRSQRRQVRQSTLASSTRRVRSTKDKASTPRAALGWTGPGVQSRP